MFNSSISKPSSSNLPTACTNLYPAQLSTCHPQKMNERKANAACLSFQKMKKGVREGRQPGTLCLWTGLPVHCSS